MRCVQKCARRAKDWKIRVVLVLDQQIPSGGPDGRPRMQKARYEIRNGLFVYIMVPGPGFEPGTHGFSVRCSTD